MEDLKLTSNLTAESEKRFEQVQSFLLTSAQYLGLIEVTDLMSLDKHDQVTMPPCLRKGAVYIDQHAQHMESVL